MIENDTISPTGEETITERQDIPPPDRNNVDGQPPLGVGQETIVSNDEQDLDATCIVSDEDRTDTSRLDKLPKIGLYEAGLEIDQYTLIRSLGKGSMGEVWLANQTNPERQVALKLLNQFYLKVNPGFIDRFINEMDRTTKMHHPNILTAYGGNRDESRAYMATEFIDGFELSDRLEKEKVIPEKEALKIARDIADALRYAWNSFNIIHRDLKPSNIMVTKEGVPKLMDMGLSKTLMDDDNPLTVTGEILGTPNYMSPEQAAASKSVDFRADIYGLGATLYHLVTGSLPHESSSDMTVFDLLKKVVTHPIIPARDKNPDVSAECSALIGKMTANAMADRHSSWEEVLRDIDLVLKGKPPRGVDIKKYSPDSVTGSDLSASEKSSHIIPLIFGILGVVIIVTVIVVIAIMNQ